MNKDYDLIKKEIEELAKDLNAKIIVKEEKGHFEEYSTASVGRTTYADTDPFEREEYHKQHMETRWVVDKPAETKPDVEKRQKAIIQLKEICENNKYYRARYSALKLLKPDPVKKVSYSYSYGLQKPFHYGTQNENKDHINDQNLKSNYSDRIKIVSKWINELFQNAKSAKRLSTDTEDDLKYFYINISDKKLKESMYSFLKNYDNNFLISEVLNSRMKFLSKSDLEAVFNGTHTPIEAIVKVGKYLGYGQLKIFCKILKVFRKSVSKTKYNF